MAGISKPLCKQIGGLLGIKQAYGVGVNPTEE